MNQKMQEEPKWKRTWHFIRPTVISVAVVLLAFFIMQGRPLATTLATAEGMTDQPALSLFYHETILPDMDAVRSAVDAAETYIPDSILPYPNYEKLLFSV